MDFGFPPTRCVSQNIRVRYSPRINQIEFCSVIVDYIICFCVGFGKTTSLVLF